MGAKTLQRRTQTSNPLRLRSFPLVSAAARPSRGSAALHLTRNPIKAAPLLAVLLDLVFGLKAANRRTRLNLIVSIDHATDASSLGGPLSTWSTLWPNSQRSAWPSLACGTTPHGGGYDDLVFRGCEIFISASNPAHNPNTGPAIVRGRLQGETAEVSPALAGTANAIDITSDKSVKLNFRIQIRRRLILMAISSSTAKRTSN
jgi:hypothetical protein